MTWRAAFSHALSAPSKQADIEPLSDAVKALDGVEMGVLGDGLDQSSKDISNRPSNIGRTKPLGMVSSERRRDDLSRRVGLIIRGRSFYVRLKVPKRLQPIVGKTHFVRSLKTGLVNEAVRQSRVMGEHSNNGFSWPREGRQRRRHGQAIQAPILINAAPEPAGSRLKDLLDIFLSDLSKNRSEKTILG